MSQPEKLTVRKSILLRPSEEAKFESIAAKAGVSFGQMARMAMKQYQGERPSELSAQEEIEVDELVEELNQKLEATQQRVSAALRAVAALTEA